MARPNDGRQRDPAARLCPKCRDRMRERPLQESGIRIDACPRCHGLWFDRWELEGHLGGPESQFVPTANARVTDRGCPVCRIAMTSFVAAGTDVAIDLCEECRGVWLDAGELKHLEQCARPPKGLVASLKRILGM